MTDKYAERILKLTAEWEMLEKHAKNEDAEPNFYKILATILEDIDGLDVTSETLELIEKVESRIFQSLEMNSIEAISLKTLQNIYFSPQKFSLKGHLYLALLLRLKLLFFEKQESGTISAKTLEECHEILHIFGLERHSLLTDKQPLIILAGGTSKNVEYIFKIYTENLIQAFKGFSGYLISGGTPSGVSGVAGKIQETYPESLTVIGCMPKENPWNVPEDERYASIIKTLGTNFSIFEPLQYWYDILCSDIPLPHVRLIGINGGNISAFEFRFALLFRVTTGIVEESGREATKLFQDPFWSEKAMLQSLTHSVDSFQMMTHFNFTE